MCVCVSYIKLASVPDKGPLNGCVYVCVTFYLLILLMYSGYFKVNIQVVPLIFFLSGFKKSFFGNNWCRFYRPDAFFSRAPNSIGAMITTRESQSSASCFHGLLTPWQSDVMISLC